MFKAFLHIYDFYYTVTLYRALTTKNVSTNEYKSDKMTFLSFLPLSGVSLSDASRMKFFIVY